VAVKIYFLSPPTLITEDFQYLKCKPGKSFTSELKALLAMQTLP